MLSPAVGVAVRLGNAGEREGAAGDGVREGLGQGEALGSPPTPPEALGFLVATALLLPWSARGVALANGGVGLPVAPHSEEGVAAALPASLAVGCREEVGGWL